MSRALITGASSGIGWEFAKLCAQRGDDVILVARREERLAVLGDELRSEHHVEVEVLIADLAALDGVTKVVNRLGDAASPIDLLINNAGYGSHGAFVDLKVEKELHQVRTNVEAVVALTHAALNAMKLQGTGGVINVSSVVSFMPWPNHAIYAATKAFVTSFTESLSQELRGTKLHVMALCPGPTRTEFGDVLGDRMVEVPNFVWMKPRAVAKSALRAYSRHKVVHIAGLRNKVWAVPAMYVPRWIRRSATALVGRQIIH